MIINTVKITDGGYVVNGNTFVPEAPGNRDYAEVIAWINAGGVVEPADVVDVRTAEIIARLAEIDALRIRPLSELMLSPESQFARDKLTSLEIEAAELRAELAKL